jgi:aryl-alcohol dehydrogenase-like predicted oxidoreductase
LAIGLTVTGPHQAETIHRAVDLARFDTVQATWNLLERSAEQALAAAHADSVGVIVKEALANGRLAGRSGVAELQDAARSRGCTPDAIALAAALAQPWADIVLSGATTAVQLESNLAARAVELTPETVHRLGGLREEPAAYWQTRAALPWN